MFLNSGLFTFGLIDAVLFVGPIAPATKRGLSLYILATDFAILAAS